VGLAGRAGEVHEAQGKVHGGPTEKVEVHGEEAPVGVVVHGGEAGQAAHLAVAHVAALRGGAADSVVVGAASSSSSFVTSFF